MNADLFQLTSEYLKEACIVAGKAFQEDPLMVYSYPKEKDRIEKSQYGFYMLYNYGIKHRFSYATSKNLEGITIWLPPDKIHLSAWTMMRYGGFYTMRKVGLKFKAIKRTMSVYSYLERKHRQLVPYNHWYLQNIAVRPEEQGKGYGKLLLSSMIKKIESEKLPIYLETNTEKAMSIYRKFGFEILEHSIIPKTNIPLWCMLRKSM
jgi:ribosomal protein S18 acetylase RimI-like enzyme